MDFPWFDPQLAVEALEKRASPEVSKRSRAWVARGRVREVSEEAGEEGVTVRGRVTDGGEECTPVLSLSAVRVDGACSCGERPWPCAHLLALARGWARSAPGQGAGGGSGEARVPWRELLSDLVPGGRKLLTAGPDGTLVHWLELRPAAPSVWTVAVSWRLHRATGRGLGRGQAVHSEALLGDGGASIPAAERRVVQTVLACAAGEPSPGGTVTVAPDAVDLVLRALAGAGQVRWQGLRSPALFELLPMRVALSGQERRGGLAMELRWEGPDGSRWEPEEIRVVGSRFPWVESNGVLSPVLGVGDGSALALLARRGVEIPAADLPALLGSVVPALENGGVPVSVSGLEGRDFLVSHQPKPRLYLWEEGGNLVATLAFAYGDYEIPGESPEPVVGVGAGQGTFVRRDMEEEFHVVSRLREFGFRMTDAGRFELHGDAAYDFLLQHLDELSATWEVFGRGELRRYRVSTTPVSLRVRLAAGVDWLDLAVETEVEDADDDLPVAEVLRALRRGARYVRLGSGAHALLPEEWSRRLGPSLETLGVGSHSVRVPHYLAPLVEEVAEQVPLRTAEGEEVWERLRRVLSGEVQVPPCAA
ncbi:MAG TPA: SNF2 helicase associated domain-containing protein, partial [Deferrisomatales bacterium]|nr:SNF2 helicase associated domain-containing protein [Deferrisomatales bacterium]